jgi:succinylglutamic semialdehyde dehydrogenase
MRPEPHFVNNEWIKGSGEEFVSTDPASGTVTWRGRSATASEVDRAIGAAAEAFDAWAETTIAERVRYLEEFRRQVTFRETELAQTICRETGKPRWESLAEVASMASKIDLSIQAYHDRRREVRGRLGDATTVVRFKPFGVIAVLGPFNLPGHLPNGHIVPALLAGNTIVFKPSEQAPLVGQILGELWESAGLPRGVFNMVQGGRDTGLALSANPRLDGLLFTGSYATGRALHASFGGHPEKIIALEMGGNNPLVVHEVCDPNAAAYLTVLSAFITAGQRCTCARRLIVPRGAQGDTFVERLVSITGRICVGPYTLDPEPFMGPVISVQAADGLVAAQEALLSQGAECLLRMARLPGPGAFLSPGLVDVTGVRDRPDVELFGPLLQVMRMADFDEAMREANKTVYGLSAGLLSDNKDLSERFFRRITAGIINWNRPLTGASGSMPFGGTKASGNNRPSGYYAADYCSYPIASLEIDRVTLPDIRPPGIDL